jgi:hypothetical protein
VVLQEAAGLDIGFYLQSACERLIVVYVDAASVNLGSNLHRLSPPDHFSDKWCSIGTGDNPTQNRSRWKN